MLGRSFYLLLAILSVLGNAPALARTATRRRENGESQSVMSVPLRPVQARNLQQVITMPLYLTWRIQIDSKDSLDDPVVDRAATLQEARGVAQATDEWLKDQMETPKALADAGVTIDQVSCTLAAFDWGPGQYFPHHVSTNCELTFGVAADASMAVAAISDNVVNLSVTDFYFKYLRFSGGMSSIFRNSRVVNYSVHEKATPQTSPEPTPTTPAPRIITGAPTSQPQTEPTGEVVTLSQLYNSPTAAPVLAESTPPPSPAPTKKPTSSPVSASPTKNPTIPPTPPPSTVDDTPRPSTWTTPVKMMFGWMNSPAPLTGAELDGLLESTTRFLDAKLLDREEPGFLGVTLEWTHQEYDPSKSPVTPQLLQANIVMWYSDVVPSTRVMYYIGMLSSVFGDNLEDYITNYVRTADPSDSVLQLTTHFGWHFHDLLVEP